MCLRKKRRKKKNEVELWAVTDGMDYNTCGTVYTVTPTEEGCYEYINRFLLDKYGEHFNNWRMFHSEPEYDWNYYVQEVLLGIMDEDFYIVAFYADVSAIALAYRVYEGCMPLGCSYEFQIEQIAYKCYLDDKKKENEEENIDDDIPIQ